MPDDLDRAVDARIDAYRPESTPPFEAIEARRRRRGRGRLAGATAAVVFTGVAVAGIAVLGLGGTNPERRERLAPVAAPAWDGRSGPLAATGDSTGDCSNLYTLAGLAERTIVFDGTVTAIGDDVSNRPGMGQLSLAGVEFSVNEWYRGDGSDTATIDLPISGQAVSAGDDDGPSYGVGTRLLVAGEPRWGGDAAFDQPIAWTCGFTRYYDPETARAWHDALADPDSPAGPQRSANPPASGPDVLLHHCGIRPITFHEDKWEVTEAPFDATNAPSTFSGQGTYTLSGDTLVFLDRAGARLIFTPDDGKPNGPPCA